MDQAIQKIYLNFEWLKTSLSKLKTLCIAELDTT